ncbi:MAG: SIMPL domain-containing protein [Candidatus Parcubacteria bacterium]|nr:SIMPL domain-containing protein [Candidatus Parcubacteria bacterium]
MEEIQSKCKKSGLALVIMALILGASLFASTFWVSAMIYKVKALNFSIAVTGSAEKIVKSDTVKWTSNFSRTTGQDSLKEGSNQIKADLAVILKKFKDSEVKDEEITVQTVTISPVCESSQNVIYDQYGNQTCGGNKLSGYLLKQTILIESDQVDKISKLANEAAGYFIDQGIIFSSQGLEYYYNKLADIKMDLISEATKNAQERAAQIATSTGANLGNLISASTGVFQVTTVNSTEISDYGYYDTSTIDKKVTAVVRTSFNLNK